MASARAIARAFSEQAASDGLVSWCEGVCSELTRELQLDLRPRSLRICLTMKRRQEVRCTATRPCAGRTLPPRFKAFCLRVPTGGLECSADEHLPAHLRLFLGAGMALLEVAFWIGDTSFLR
eukprot:6201440-Pleurochrysis_carterae.AAC.2